MSDSSWLLEQFDRTEALIARWPQWMQDMLAREKRLIDGSWRNEKVDKQAEEATRHVAEAIDEAIETALADIVAALGRALVDIGAAMQRAAVGGDDD